MRKRHQSVPNHLKNGDPLPNFADIVRAAPNYPRYKIVVFSIDAFCNRYRLVHAFYIFLLSDDPSRIKSLMESRDRNSTPGFENGTFIEEMTCYREYLTIQNMIMF
jgi:hypothetical protein